MSAETLEKTDGIHTANPPVQKPPTKGQLPRTLHVHEWNTIKDQDGNARCWMNNSEESKAIAQAMVHRWNVYIAMVNRITELERQHTSDELLIRRLRR